VAILTDVFASAKLEAWRDRLALFSGRWPVVQDTLEAAVHPQTVTDGHVQECHTASGTPFRLVAAPVQFDVEPAAPTRAPEFNEHGDSILATLGLDEDAIIDLKVRGVVA
jgi:crotonobetainyl-CoA:carnitine CoA-transferase CaiB-like acyl-CoA transferase